MWKKNKNEPVVLTLSSDEEDNDNSSLSINNVMNVGSCELNSKICEPLNPKEPIILPNTDYSDWKMYHKNFSCSKLECINTNDSNFFITLQCQSVRIGSYKVIPQEKLTVSLTGIKMLVSPISTGEASPVHLIFPLKNIRKILAHLEDTFPVFFIYVTDPFARNIRQQLNMNDEAGFYFDPCSNEESQKRLTLLPEILLPDSVSFLRNIFNFSFLNQEDEEILFFEELTKKDANEILVRSSPVEVNSLAISSRPLISYETKTLLVFPPPPNKGGITITIDDYACLKEEQFLNDVLIDFYLKWLHMCHIKNEDRERTHVFSTFFYKRLTAKPKNSHRPSYETDPNLSPAERRHARVQSWTKSVDIFSKDFILIPINEKSHWFLTVICFPYLNGPVNADTNQEISMAEVAVPKRASTRLKNKVEIPVIDDSDWSDRDEAEGDDCELEDEDIFDDEPNLDKLKNIKSNIKIRQPCILILDSISGTSRSRIVSTLRDYLTVEYVKRKKKHKTFTKDNMMGACPKVPQQMNYTDCGLFTLQYAESFFKTPLEDFRLPIRSLENWFKQEEVSKKRMQVANLIKSLMDELKPNHGICLPSLFASFGGCTNEEAPVLDENKSSFDDNINNSSLNSKCDDDKNIDEFKSSNSVLDSNNSENNEPNSDSSISREAELFDTSELSDICRQDVKTVPKISLPLKNAISKLNSKQIQSSSSSSNSFINGLTFSCNNRDTVIKESKSEISKPSLRTSCEQSLSTPSILRAQKLSDSFQLLRESYSKMDEDEASSDDGDDIFLSCKKKRLKTSSVEL